MRWTTASIIDELRRLKRRKTDLSYNGLARLNQSLVSAAAYHFGSYRKAVEAAGLDYADVVRRPRWTKQTVITQIKAARRNGTALNWASVINNNSDLSRAAFASLQPRLFGSWDKALHAAGVDSDEVSPYRNWNMATVVAEIKALKADEQAYNSSAVQREDPGLHAAAVRYFGSYDEALRAAKIDPKSTRQRRTWTSPAVLKEIRRHHRDGHRMSDSVVRSQWPALYGACVRMFGSFSKARTEAKVPFSRRKQ